MNRKWIFSFPYGAAKSCTRREWHKAIRAAGASRFYASEAAATAALPAIRSQVPAELAKLLEVSEVTFVEMFSV